MNPRLNIFKTFLLLNTLILGCATLSCLSVKPIRYEDDKAVALKQVERFHDLYNNERFDDVYDTFTESLKSKITREAFITRLRTLKDEKGRIIGFREIKEPGVEPKATYRVIRFAFETNYEKGVMSEGFAFLVDGQEATIDTYLLSISSGS